MKTVEKTTKYIDDTERKNIVLYCASIDIYSYNKLSSMLGITPAYLSLVMSGKRPLTTELERKFGLLGYRF